LSKTSKYISNLPVVKSLLQWSKNSAIPGFGGVSMYNVISFVYKEANADNITTRANAIAFSFFLSLFPFIIFMLPILYQSPMGSAALDLLRKTMSDFIPANAQSYIFGIIDGIEKEGHFGLLSLGFFLSIFFASNGMMTLMNGFDKTYNETFKRRGFFHKRLVAIGLTLLLSILLMSSFVLIILSQPIINLLIDQLHISSYTGNIFSVIKWILVLFMFYTIVTIIYIYGPSMYKRISFFSPGATLATLLSIFTSILFSWFVNNFGQYNEIYGSIGALIVILIWIQLNAFILLIGFELNASIAVNKDLKQIVNSE